jgi:hypothetical protein
MIDYHQVLSDLEARRASLVADLDASIRTVRQILQAAGQGQGASFRVATEGQVNNTKKVFDFLVSQAPKALSPKAIAEGTGLAEHAVRGIVNRLSKGKKAKLDKPARGKYRAKPQAQEMSAAA